MFVYVRAYTSACVRACGCVPVRVYKYLNDCALSPFSLAFSLCIFHSLSLSLSLSVFIFLSLSLPSFLSLSVAAFLSLSHIYYTQ